MELGRVQSGEELDLDIFLLRGIFVILQKGKSERKRFYCEHKSFVCFTV